MSPTTSSAPTTPDLARSAHASLPAMLLAHADERPQASALRQKELGIWREIHWGEYARRAADIGLGLVELGVRSGERVAIQSSNRYQWLLADAGIQGVGAASVGLYPTSPPSQVEYLLRHSESMVLVAENEEQLDKALEVRAGLPNLEKIIVVDTRGIRELADPMLMSLDELEALGRQRPREEWAERVRALEPADAAAIIYTSGATGRPKAAMLSHANLVVAGGTTAEALDARSGDEVFSYLPMCHAVERVCSSAAALQAGFTVNFGEGAQSFALDMAEVQPTIFLGVPRIWEEMAASVNSRIAGSGRLQRSAFNYWTKRGARAAERQQGGRGRGFWDLLGRFELYRSVRKKLGLRRVRAAISTAAPVSTSTLELLWSVGVPVREGYGLTEFTGLATLNPTGGVRLGSVGTAMKGVEVRILDDGEVALRGPTTFSGYFRDSGSEQPVDDDGWLLTGDLGTLDADGYLTITGRKKAVIITSGGRNISPVAIERRLVASRYVEHAVVVGDGAPHLSALIEIDPSTVSAWALGQGLDFKTYTDLVGLDEVRGLIDGVVDSVNEQLADVERIRSFEIVTTQLDEQDGQLTAIGEIRRQAVLEEFSHVIASLTPPGEDA